MSLPPLIWDDFHADHVPPDAMDALWARGWRHFGTQFYRYSIMEHEGAFQTVVPLRVDLSEFTLSKSQRRVLRKNADIRVEFAPAEISGDVRGMFHRHKERFAHNVPDDLEVFLSAQPSSVPCQCLELRCHLAGERVAVSYFDVGQTGVSSVYGMFEPAHASRSLGIFTLLTEMQWAKEQGKQFAYPGYATHGASHYDYKKQFAGLQGYDWATETWRAWPQDAAVQAINS